MLKRFFLALRNLFKDIGSRSRIYHYYPEKKWYNFLLDGQRFYYHEEGFYYNEEGTVLRSHRRNDIAFVYSDNETYPYDFDFVKMDENDNLFVNHLEKDMCVVKKFKLTFDDLGYPQYIEL